MCEYDDLPGISYGCCHNMIGTMSAGAAPEEGINVLDAVILMFNGINALRQHFTEDVRIHRIIKEGVIAANIVHDKATAQFYVRTKKKKIFKN